MTSVPAARADAFGRHAAATTDRAPGSSRPSPRSGSRRASSSCRSGSRRGHDGALLALEVARRFDAADGCVLDRAAALLRLARLPSTIRRARRDTADDRPSASSRSPRSVSASVSRPSSCGSIAMPARRTHELLGRISGPDGRTLLLSRASGIGVVVRSADAGAVSAELRRALGDGAPADGSRLAVVSRVAATTDAVAAVCGEVDAIATMLERNRVTDRVVAIDELAGSRLVLASCTLDVAASIVGETLRPLARASAPLSTVLLDTVRALIATGGSIREAARRLERAREHRPLPPAADPRADAARPLGRR